ncbi:hypothetical protein [Cryptosporangium sp. NPDC048952]|uniref:hypothetical protein n=1 Tax=Cryptosporangium sp. NPDC048952 TaxID=3363961 RepID=UPI0037233E48
MGTGPAEREIPTSRPVPTVTRKPPGRRMSSAKVRIGMIGALSLTVAACGSGDDVQARCVDQRSYQNNDGSYNVVDDDYCDDDGRYYGSHGGYFWYYGGTSRGSRIYRGTTVKPKDAHITTTKGKTLQRGGFGSRSSSGS